MRKIQAYLVYDNKKYNQRHYYLSSPLTKFIKCFGDKGDILEYVQESKWLSDFEKSSIFRAGGYEFVCISDAHTHIERLAFAGVYMSRFGFARSHIQIDGKLTFSIHGGDSNAVYPDEVYLRHLAKINDAEIEILPFDFDSVSCMIRWKDDEKEEEVLIKLNKNGSDSDNDDGYFYYVDGVKELDEMDTSSDDYEFEIVRILGWKKTNR